MPTAATSNDTKTLDSLKDATLRKRLERFVAQYREGQDLIAATKAANDSLLEDTIAPLLNKLKLRRLDAPEQGWMALKQPWSNSTIQKKLLLSRGVSMADIKASTVKKSGTKWQVRGIKEREEQSDGDEE